METVLLIILAVALVAGSIAVMVWGVLAVRRALGRLVEEEGDREAHSLFQQQIDGLRQQVSSNLGETARLLQQELHRMRGTLDEQMNRTVTATGQVQSQLVKMGEEVKRVSEVGKDISTLQDILRAPKLRGGLGELFLGDLLAQMLPTNRYDVQYSFRTGQRVDAVIRVGDRLVPIDAKFPLENFRRILDSTEAEERKSVRRAFISDVRKHIDKIAQSYILPEEGTFDFALMYIPAENVYYETIVQEDGASPGEGLFEYSVKRRVIPVSPNSFYAYLQVIVLGLKGMHIEETARELLSKLGSLKKDFGLFEEKFTLVGKHLGNSKTAYEDAEKRLNRVGTRLENLSELAPGKEAPQLLGAGQQ